MLVVSVGRSACRTRLKWRYLVENDAVRENHEGPRQGPARVGKTCPGYAPVEASKGILPFLVIATARREAQKGTEGPDCAEGRDPIAKVEEEKLLVGPSEPHEAQRQQHGSLAEI